jgi:alpha-ketoglutarate-dependent taurine dioxygenase
MSVLASVAQDQSAQTKEQAFELRPLHPLFAAEIIGFDISAPADDAAVAAIAEALGHYGVLVFRDQKHVTPEQQIAFSRAFGVLEIHVQKKFLLKDHPEILIVSNVVENGVPLGLVDAGRYWHSDLSYLAEPSLGSLLHAIELPSEGGDTLFGSLTAAYDALDDGIKARIKNLTAVHDYNRLNKQQAAKSDGLRPLLSAEQEKTVPPVIHPVVRRHELTGAPILFVSEGFTTKIVELPEEEGAGLLAQLFEHQKQDRFHYRHHWQEGDLVFWDNRATIHLATGTPPGLRRTLYRTTVRGPKPTAFG